MYRLVLLGAGIVPAKGRDMWVRAWRSWRGLLATLDTWAGRGRVDRGLFRSGAFSLRFVRNADGM